MPELDFAFLADFARAKGNSIDALSIGVDLVMAEGLPSAVSLAIALRLHFARAECDVLHRLEAIAQGPDGQRRAELSLDIMPRWPTIDPPSDRVGVQAVIPLSLELFDAGRHSVDLALDGRAVKDIAFEVVVPPAL